MMEDNNTRETLEILYQDEFLIAVNKPSGLLVHKSPIDRHETRFALQIVRDQIGQYVDQEIERVVVVMLDDHVAGNK